MRHNKQRAAYGAELRARRERCGLSREQAVLAGVSTRTVATVESADYPSGRSADRLELVLRQVERRRDRVAQAPPGAPGGQPMTLKAGTELL